MYTKTFDKISKTDINQVGGKGASLGEMRKAGFPVPPGFVITTDAFREFHDKPFSESFKKEIFEAYDNLKTDRVAVRSSAVAEDSSTASWAGQLESYLNVTREDLLEKIKLCFKSIESDHVQSYIEDKNINNDDLAVAVVIQSMVDSDISGVMFTTNPINGNPNEIVIESSYGLGEFIVQGKVTPDSYIIDNNTLQIKNKSLGNKEKMYSYRDGKNVSTNVDNNLRKKFSLTNTQIKKLAAHGKKIEKHYGFPCDIEWAFKKDMLYITQSRPITTLDKSAYIIEKTTIPNWDNKEIFRWGPIPGNIFYISDYVEAAVRLNGYLGQRFPETVLLFHEGQMVWLCAQEEMTSTGAKIFERFVMQNKNRSFWSNHFEKAVNNLETFQNNLNPEKLDKKELAKTLQNFYSLIVDFWLPTIPAELGNYGSPDVLRKYLSKIIKNNDELNNAVQILIAPEELSYNQEEEIELSKTNNLDEHTNKYFWLQNNYSGEQLLDKQFFLSRKKELNNDIKKETKQKIQQVKKSKQQIINKYNLSAEVINMANIIWQNIVWQDHRKKISLLTFHYKSILLQKAAELLHINRSVLENYFFTEVIDALYGKELSDDKNREYCGVRAIDDWVLLDGDEAEVAWKAYANPQIAKSDKQHLVGTVASKGKNSKTVAKAKIVMDPHAEFPKGYVLITTMTSPEYVILMRKASAIVTDTGGLTSHAAIISREIGIPCIVGTKFATQTLKDGDMVEVDTDKGTVTKLNL